MKYYSENPYLPSAKNKLEQAIYVALKEYNRFIFSVKLLPVVKSSIENIVSSLNAQYKRCKPITVRWSNGVSDNKGYEGKKKDNIDNWSLYLSANDYTPVLRIILAKEESDL